MFHKQSTSKINIHTNIDKDKVDNNFCYADDVFDINIDLKDFIDNRPQIVVVTKHLCLPCPRLYTDIFKIILIVCKDSSHKDDKYTDDCKTNRIIQQLLAGDVK